MNDYDYEKERKIDQIVSILFVIGFIIVGICFTMFMIFLIIEFSEGGMMR